MARSREPAAVEDEKAPVRVALRYLENRIGQLDYKTAIEKELPIGTGMIEGGHRHVLQKRLKISEAWWTLHNIEAMHTLGYEEPINRKIPTGKNYKPSLG